MTKQMEKASALAVDMVAARGGVLGVGDSEASTESDKGIISGKDGGNHDGPRLDQRGPDSNKGAKDPDADTAADARKEDGGGGGGGMPGGFGLQERGAESASEVQMEVQLRLLHAQHEEAQLRVQEARSELQSLVSVAAGSGVATDPRLSLIHI